MEVEISRPRLNNFRIASKIIESKVLFQPPMEASHVKYLSTFLVKSETK